MAIRTTSMIPNGGFSAGATTGTCGGAVSVLGSSGSLGVSDTMAESNLHERRGEHEGHEGHKGEARIRTHRTIKSPYFAIRDSADKCDLFCDLRLYLCGLRVL